MNKQELITKLMGKTRAAITHADAERIVNGFMDEVKNAVASGDTVSLPGFGTFSAVQRNSRTARNPQTGGTIEIPARKAPVFKVSKAFKEIVNK